MRVLLLLLMLTVFHSMTMREALAAWDDYDKAGTYLDGIAVLAKQDRFYLLVKVLRRTDALHPWIYARCREVEREPDDCLDLWARFHYKSTLITFAGALQEILNDPEITIGILSHTKPDAVKFLRQIKMELETNIVLQSAFPDILWSDPRGQAPLWSEEKGITVKRHSNAKEATVEAHGLVEGMPTGAHYRLRIYEDVVTDKAVTTPDQIAKATAAWELSDNLGMSGGRRWHIGTRYSYADTYEEILKRGILKPRIYPATDDGTKGGNPVLLSPEEWAEKIKTQGEAVLSCQMLQNPIAGLQAMFDVKWLQVYEIRPETLNVYILTDPARSTHKGSANTAMLVLGLDYARNKYLLDGFNHRMALKERWERVRDLRRKWSTSPGVQNVTVGYESFGAQADLDYFHERMEVEGDAFSIVELDWPREGPASKEQRMQRLEPDFRNGRFFLPYPSDPERLTSTQLKVSRESPYRVSRSIRKKDGEGNVYDVVKQFKEQVHFCPHGLVDLVDACSRIYDIDAHPPIIIDQDQLEPEVEADG